MSTLQMAQPENYCFVRGPVPVPDWDWAYVRREEAVGAVAPAIASRVAAGALAVAPVRTAAGKPVAAAVVAVAAAIAAGCNYTGADSAIDAAQVARKLAAARSRPLSRGCL